MPKKLLPLLLLLAVLSHSLTPQTVYILIYVLFDKITSLFLVSIRFRVLEPFLASHTGMWLTLWHLVCSLYRSLLFSLVGPFDHHYIFSIGLLCCNRKSSSSITSAQSNMRCMIIDHTHTCTTHKLSLYLSLYLHTVCVFTAHKLKTMIRFLHSLAHPQWHDGECRLRKDGKTKTCPLGFHASYQI